jgi:MFS family permease
MWVSWTPTWPVASLRQKNDPAKVARIAIDGIEAGAYEIVIDDLSRKAQYTLSSEATDTEGAGPGSRQVLLILSGLMLGMLLAALDQTIVATALPTITGDLNGLDHIGWVVTAYLLAVAVVMPIYGKVGDLFGRKALFKFAIVVFLVGSAASRLAQSMDQLIAFRAVQGAGAGRADDRRAGHHRRHRQSARAGQVPRTDRCCLRAGIGDRAAARWVPRGQLVVALDFLHQRSHRRRTLIVTSIVLRLPRPQRKPRIDYLGMALLGSWVVCFVLLTNWGSTTYAWSSSVIIALGVAALGLAAGWVVSAKFAADPVIPLRLFRDQSFRSACASSLILGVAMFGAISYLPTYLPVVTGADATTSGLLLMPLMGGLLIASVASVRLIARTGHYTA